MEYLKNKKKEQQNVKDISKHNRATLKFCGGYDQCRRFCFIILFKEFIIFLCDIV